MFEDLLRRHLALLARPATATLALVGGSCDQEARYCAGKGLPDHHVLALGYVVVPPGTSCPDPEGLELRYEGCNPEHVHEGTVCGFDHVDRDQGTTPDYGYFTDSTEGSPNAVDVCWYEGVFDASGSVCGRPLLRDGEPLTAPSVATSAWHEPTVTDAASPELRARAAAWWLRAALLEHASIASFARFSVELLRYGAPPELLQGAHRAALDEVEHARLAFALASSWSGRALGPGPFDLQGATRLSASLAEFAEAVVREGCVGETLAAIDAAARLARTTDRATRRALEVIVRDESNHAALAWQTLRWVLSMDPTTKARIDEVFAEERARVGAAVGRTSDDHAILGLLDDAEQAVVFRDAWDRVIGPAIQVLA